jgi:hypothetical protein
MQHFLDYTISHKVICGSEDLSSFLTGQDHEFETRKASSSVYINSDPLNLALSQVLTDGSHAFEPITSSKSYYGKTVKLAKKATQKMYDIGGIVSGAIWSGATYITGSED